MNILDEIVVRTLKRVEEQKKMLSLESLIQFINEDQNISKDQSLSKNQMKEDSKSRLMNLNKLSFEQAIKKPGISFICEVKKASPSKGLIAKEFPYLEIAKEYEAAGASAISVLTEPYYFQGNSSYLSKIAENVSIPVLRKDFIIDEYQIYEAKILHASAILLICAILSDEQLTRYIGIADSLGLDALVEAHDEEEVKRAINANARIIGVNNRNLKTFTVDIMNSIRLRNMVPKDIAFISESGIKSSDDISRLEEHGVDAVLIGETLMTAPDKKEAIAKLRGNI